MDLLHRLTWQLAKSRLKWGCLMQDHTWRFVSISAKGFLRIWLQAGEQRSLSPHHAQMTGQRDITDVQEHLVGHCLTDRLSLVVTDGTFVSTPRYYENFIPSMLLAFLSSVPIEIYKIVRISWRAFWAHSNNLLLPLLVKTQSLPLPDNPPFLPLYCYPPLCGCLGSIMHPLLM